MEKFTLINKYKLSIIVFEPFEDSSKYYYSSMVNASLMSFGCVFKRSRGKSWKALGLNPSYERETNIKNYYE